MVSLEVLEPIPVGGRIARIAEVSRAWMPYWDRLLVVTLAAVAMVSVFFASLWLHARAEGRKMSTDLRAELAAIRRMLQPLPPPIIHDGKTHPPPRHAPRLPPLRRRHPPRVARRCVLLANLPRQHAPRGQLGSRSCRLRRARLARWRPSRSSPASPTKCTGPPPCPVTAMTSLCSSSTGQTPARAPPATRPTMRSTLATSSSSSPDVSHPTEARNVRPRCSIRGDSLDSRRNDLKREIEVSAKLHQRQRAALLGAIDALRKTGAR
jgi:hypothetical protein